MGEALPVVAGILIGLLAVRLPGFSTRGRWVLGAVLTVAAGVLATVVNGEGLPFLPFDIGLVGLCATAAAALPGILHRARRRLAGVSPPPERPDP